MVFGVSIIYHSDFITHYSKMVGPTKRSLFGFVFKFCFHYSIIWFFSVSYENWKHILGVFKLWKQNYDDIFVNTHIEGPTVRPFALSNTVVFFFFFFFLLFFFLVFHSGFGSLLSILFFFSFLFMLVFGFGCIFFLSFSHWVSGSRHCYTN